MKYLMVLAIVLVAVWLWRGNRASPDGRAATRAAKPPKQLQDMVSCPVCDLHVPRGEAAAGRTGITYCSPEHRRRAEG